MERQTPGHVRLVMLVLRLWPDHNPLRRPADRAEAIVVAVLLVAFLAGAPLTALAAARWVAASGQRAERAQAGWRRVPAVLLRDAPATGGSLENPVPFTQVAARWSVPGGLTRIGKVYARPGERAGSVVMIWADSSGRQTQPPVRPAEVASQEFLAAVSAPVVLSLVLLAAWIYATMILERRRMADWDADWAVTGPQWTGPW